MPLDPQIADVLDRVRRADRPPLWSLEPVAARIAYAKAARVLEIAAAPLYHVEDFTIAASDGYALPLRRYVPRVSASPLPLVVFCHGGGFTIGDLATHDAVCRMLARDAGCIVLAVDYRLAPEHPFPKAVEDAFDALTWARAHTAQLGADPSRIAVAGDSAGGTLTAVNAIRARDAGWPLVLQLLIYPGTGRDRNTASHRAYAEGYLLDAKLLHWFRNNYQPDAKMRDDWRFAPLDGKAANGAPVALDGVAPACILVADHDPLHDEGVAYAMRLREAGIAVDLLDYPGMVHGFFQYGGAIDTARVAHRDAVLALRRAFGTG